MTTERKLPQGWGLVNCEEINEKDHRAFATVLESEHDKERARSPHAMTISFVILDVPEEPVIEGAARLLSLKGWQVDYSMMKDTGGRSAWFSMDAPAKR